MPLALTVESLDAVEESLRGLYVEKDGAFVLDADLPDTGALKRAKDHEKALRQAAEAQAREFREKLDAIEAENKKRQDDGHRKSGDVDALDKSWREKYEKDVAEREGAYKTAMQMVKDMTAGNAARSMARELAIEGGEDALFKLIQHRFGVEIVDGAPVISALTSDGKNSALTMDELRAELKSDKSLAALLAGSKAAGGGTAGNRGGSATVPEGKKPSEMTVAEKAAFISEHGLEAFQKQIRP
jgi:hypothetical protein